MNNSIELEDFYHNIIVTLIGYMLHQNQIVRHGLYRPRDICCIHALARFKEF